MDAFRGGEGKRMKAAPASASLPHHDRSFRTEDDLQDSVIRRMGGRPAPRHVRGIGRRPGGRLYPLLGRRPGDGDGGAALRSEEHTSELQSLMRISYAVFCLKKKK